MNVHQIDFLNVFSGFTTWGYALVGYVCIMRYLTVSPHSTMTLLPLCTFFYINPRYLLCRPKLGLTQIYPSSSQTLLDPS